MVDLGRPETNCTLQAWLPDLVDPHQRLNETWLRLHRDLDVEQITEALAVARASTDPRPLPGVDRRALNGLKFSDALPLDLAIDTLARRMVDENGAVTTLTMELVVVHE